MAALPRGFQVHRSHWVANTAIKSVGRGRVELVTGLTVPLSRHRRKAFDAWLDTTAV
jgi:DNA-binding LytR/AlgR family response regulator